GGCWTRREQPYDALHDGRSRGRAGGRRVGVVEAAPRDVLGVPGGARSAVPAHRATQGAARAPAGPRSVAGGARDDPRPPARPPPSLGRGERGRRRGRSGPARVPTLLVQERGRRRSGGGEAAVGG